MASPIPDPNKPVHIPKYLELVYDESDALPPPSLTETDLVSACSNNNIKQQTPYEIPINLNNVDANHSQIENHSHNIPVESSNCSSISGDESSMQALLGQAPPPPPPPTNDPTVT